MGLPGLENPGYPERETLLPVISVTVFVRFED